MTTEDLTPVPANRSSTAKKGLTLTTGRKWLLRIGFFLVLITVWELYAGTVSPALLAPPSGIAQSFYRLYVVSPVMLEELGTTVFALAIGLFLAIVLGVLLGIAMGLSRRVEWLLGPYVTFLFSIPTIALIPLLVIWLGIDAQLRIFLVLLSAIFPVIINTSIGVRSADRDLIETATSFNGTRLQTLLTVRLPESLPFVFAGINVALGLALAGVVVAEMTATITGIGGLIITYANYFQTANLFVPILTLMFGSVALTELVAWLERKSMPWQTTARTR
jgi:NitT/TauT family transport system permease protein